MSRPVILRARIAFDLIERYPKGRTICEYTQGVFPGLIKADEARAVMADFVSDGLAVVVQQPSKQARAGSIEVYHASPALLSASGGGC